MTTREIKKEEWKPFFDHLSKKGGLEKKQAEVDVISLNLGDQLAAEWVPMFGIVYEPRTGILEIMLEGLTHMIHHPRTIYVEEKQLELISIDVTDDNNIQHVIRLRDPLPLPSP